MSGKAREGGREKRESGRERRQERMCPARVFFGPPPDTARAGAPVARPWPVKGPRARGRGLGGLPWPGLTVRFDTGKSARIRVSGAISGSGMYGAGFRVEDRGSRGYGLGLAYATVAPGRKLANELGFLQPRF